MNATSVTCEKVYPEFPFAHRQPNHDGHCQLVHGHNWSLRFVFRARELDSNGFVVDFGKLKFLKAWLEDRFDHTLVINHDDPQLAGFKASEAANLCKLYLVENCGAEGLATHLLTEVNRLLLARMDLAERGVTVCEVTVYEDSKNSATVKL